MRERDTQRQRVYDAEDSLMTPEYESDPYNQLNTVNEMQVWVNRIVGSTWFRNRWPIIENIRVADGRRRRRAAAFVWQKRGLGGLDGLFVSAIEGEIRMPRHTRYKLIVLHEVAHVVAEVQYGRGNIAPHGREYCSVYLKLARKFLGSALANSLKEAFRQGDIKYTAVRP